MKISRFWKGRVGYVYIYIYILKVMVILSYIVSSIWNPTLNGDLLHKVAFTSIREMMLQAMWVWYPQTIADVGGKKDAAHKPECNHVEECKV